MGQIFSATKLQGQLYFRVLNWTHWSLYTYNCDKPLIELSQIFCSSMIITH